MKQLFLITGLGVSAICEQGSDGMLWFIKEIIHKGGTPTIRPWAETPLDWRGKEIS